jgi:catechol 2,3-dioxygenase-like lactoylglutathione lyase family enzyme
MRGVSFHEAREGGTMLHSARLEAFVGTTDPAKSREFYQDVLGLTLVSDEPFAMIFDANGTTLRISKVEEVEAAPYTVLGWTARDIRGIVREMQAKGIRFERYPYFEQDELGVWEAPSGAKVAWFKDPDGNLLSVSSVR